MTNDEVEVSIAIKVRHSHAMCALHVDAQLRSQLLKRAVWSLPIEMCSRTRIVRRRNQHVISAIIIKIEHSRCDIAIIPRDRRVVLHKTELRAAPRERPIPIIVEQIAWVRIGPNIPVDDLRGHEVQKSVVVQVGTNRGAAISAQPKRLAVA